MSPLAWALALAILFLPLQRRLETKLHGKGIAAAVCLAVAALIVVAPAAYIGQRLVTESAEGIELVRAKIDSGALRRTLNYYPRLTPLADFIDQKVDLAGPLQAGSAWLTRTAAAILRNSVIESIRVVLTFYFLFYLLRDHRAALKTIKSLSPFTSIEMDRLFQRVADTIHATIYGTIVVAGVQGTLGGLMFWWLGLPAPIFWGFVMGLLAVVPVLGAFIVWIPAAISLAMEGSWEKALLLSIWGAIVVGCIDNWLYPILVGNRLKMHTILAFVATVGGLIVFGPSGLIIGPVGLTVTMFLIESWRDRIKAQGSRLRPLPGC